MQWGSFKRGSAVGWISRTYYSLLHRFQCNKISASYDPIQDNPCHNRLSCEELNNLYHHCGNGIISVRLERKGVLDAIKNKNWLSAVSHLRDMDQPLSRMERALRQPSPGKIHEETDT